VWADVHEQLRAFVDMTAFEELGREWMLSQARHGRLPFVPEDVGSHWSTGVQVDVVAINWRDKKILLGECKWGTGTVGRALVRELVEVKTPKVLATLPGKGEGWAVHHVFFARAEFTEAGRSEAAQRGMTIVTLAQLDETLRADAEP
jgi:uncharacterized protein